MKMNCFIDYTFKTVFLSSIVVLYNMVQVPEFVVNLLQKTIYKKSDSSTISL